VGDEVAQDRGFVAAGAGGELGVAAGVGDDVIQGRGGQDPVVGEPVNGSAELVLDLATVP
jgi:hypothetical protein